MLATAAGGGNLEDTPAEGIAKRPRFESGGGNLEDTGNLEGRVESARMRRWMGVGAVVVAIAVVEVALLRASEWMWRAHGAALAGLNASAITFYVPWLAVLVLAAWLWRPARAPWRPIWTTRDRWIVAALVLAVWLYGGSLLQLLSHGVARPLYPLYVLNGAVLAPLVEEWIFRGLLWRRIAGEERPATGTTVQAVVITSVAFALWHLPFQGHSPMWIHGLFGVSMALLRWRLRSLSPCVLVHGLGNLVTILAAS